MWSAGFAICNLPYTRAHRGRCRRLLPGGGGACRQRARELDIADRVHFLGQLRGAALRQAYQAAAALVMPSAWESFCVPVIEAMACGVPVVAARAFALPETVDQAGLTFSVDDADECSRQVRRVLNSGVQPETPAGGRRARGGRQFPLWHGLRGGAEASLPGSALPCDGRVMTWRFSPPAPVTKAAGTMSCLRGPARTGTSRCIAFRWMPTTGAGISTRCKRSCRQTGASQPSWRTTICAIPSTRRLCLRNWSGARTSSMP